MSSTTPNIGLTKTTAAETIGQNWAASNDSGGNFDIIDTKMGAVGNTSVQAQLDALSSQLETINFQYTFTNVGAGTGAIQTVSVPNPPSGKTLQLCTVNQSSGLNLVPVWISSISRGNNTVNVQLYNARTGATDVTVEIFALYW